LLAEEFVGQVAEADYCFCAAKGCAVVYYASGQTFTTAQLKVAVGVKETAGERPLCYCFGHSVATIKEELRTKGRSDALAEIRRQMRDPGCACAVMNPSGSCCLGSVGKGVQTARAELNGTTPGRRRGETIAKAGTVLSAVLASSCCWVPLVLLALGVSGAGIAGALDAYRPWFIASTVACLAAAFYFTYRPRRLASASEGCCAAAEGCCAAPSTAGKRRFNRRTLNKVMLWGVTALAAAFVLFPNYMKFFLAGGDTGEPAAKSAPVRTTTFSVKGMTCEGCSVLVERAIKEVPGVVSVTVDYDHKRAVVSTQACCPAPAEPSMDALEKAGFRGEVFEDSPRQQNQ
jgi:copper chaperone CopZ